MILNRINRVAIFKVVSRRMNERMKFVKMFYYLMKTHSKRPLIHKVSKHTSNHTYTYEHNHELDGRILVFMFECAKVILYEKGFLDQHKTEQPLKFYVTHAYISHHWENKTDRTEMELLITCSGEVFGYGCTTAIKMSRNNGPFIVQPCSYLWHSFEIGLLRIFEWFMCEVYACLNVCMCVTGKYFIRLAMFVVFCR